MFKNKYQSAYRKVYPSRDLTFTKEAVLSYMKENNEAEMFLGNGKKNVFAPRPIWKIRPVVVASVIMCLVLVIGLPTVAQNIPQFYQVINRYAPKMLDYMVPVQKSDSSNGIVLQVEAIDIQENTAEVIVSFSDVGQEDYIHGIVDMYESYKLHSYGMENDIGGCSFIEYDEAQDKAYFKVDVTSSQGTLKSSRLEFQVSKLLTECESQLIEISMDAVATESDVKAVVLSGRGGADTNNPILDKLALAGNPSDPRPGHLVLDIPLDEYSSDTMQITALAYLDGILRVQLLRGDFEEASRHMNIYMLDEMGNKVKSNMSVMWHDTVDGEEVLVDEFYFIVSQEQLETYTLWGDSEVRAGIVEGDWNIRFEL